MACLKQVGNVVYLPLPERTAEDRHCASSETVRRMVGLVGVLAVDEQTLLAVIEYAELAAVELTPLTAT